MKRAATEETANEKPQTPIKKITPTRIPIHRWLIPLSCDNIKQAKKVAVKHAGHGIESNKKVFLETSLPRESHSFFVFIPKYTSPVAMITCIVTPVASIFCVMSSGITPTK